MLISLIKIAGTLADTAISTRRRFLKNVPKFLEQYQQDFFGDELHTCFVCSPSNKKSLNLKFHKIDGGGIGFEWDPIEGLESFPNLVHGGISTTLLDEIGGVVLHSELHRFAFTVSSKFKFLAPVYQDRKLKGHATIKAKFRNYVYVVGELFDERGKILCKMNALYYVPSKGQFMHVTKNKHLPDTAISYLND